MKRALYCISISCLLITFINNPAKALENNMMLNRSEEILAEYEDNEIHIIRSITTLKRGDVGLITIKGKPDQIYTIESSFRINGKTIPVKQWRKADSNGMASFTWVVGKDTDLGTYSATIHGAGSTLNLTHTVIS